MTGDTACSCAPRGVACGVPQLVDSFPFRNPTLRDGNVRVFLDFSSGQNMACTVLVPNAKRNKMVSPLWIPFVDRLQKEVESFSNSIEDISPLDFRRIIDAMFAIPPTPLQLTRGGIGAFLEKGRLPLSFLGRLCSRSSTKKLDRTWSG